MTSARKTKAFWGETWALAVQALRAHKVRAMLAMLGVVIGSGCIVLVVTVALAGKQYILGQIEGVGANLVYASVVNADEPGSVTLADQISPADLQAVKEELPKKVVEAAGSKSVAMRVIVGGRERPVNLVGVTEGFEQIRNLEILRGSYFGQDDFVSRRKVCLLTQQLARRVFAYEDAVGKDIRIGELHFTVIGVFRERVATLGQTEITRESAIIPFSLLGYFTGEDYFQTLYVRANRPENVPMVTREVAEILQGRHRRGAQYHVQNLTGILETARQIAAALTAVLVVIALIALTISGIGIMNIMLVTVTERTREIGIRKAIGASREAILYQFLMEALAISGTGALAGILIAVMIPGLLNFLLGFFPEAGDISVPVSWISVVLAFVVSCSTGLIFGYLPANRAARLQPTESLRYE
ncbi:MAG TPA: ABC transporter permease [Candidatus Polarisedimenticolia bacterium]|nr:ABC transporter permease [Candidatus Polarisedimenticolia bacterium]